MYGMPNDSKLDRRAVVIIKPIIKPYMPRIELRNRIANRSTVTAPVKAWLTSVNEATEVMAATTSIVGDVKPARMAASPTINPPTTATVCPTAFGRRTPDSRKSSNNASIRNISIVADSGKPRRETLIVASKVNGICSILTVESATQNPGINIERKKPPIRKIRSNET